MTNNAKQDNKYLVHKFMEKAWYKATYDLDHLEWNFLRQVMGRERLMA